MDSSFLATGGKKTLYLCLSCQKDITGSIRIRCATCIHPVDICADCFCVGIKSIEHNGTLHDPSHDYKIVDCLDCSVFNPEWSVAEEILILEGQFFYYFFSFSINLNII